MENNNGFLKGILFALLVIYVISPMDLMPGVVDDLLLVVASVMTGKTGNGKTKTLPDAPSGDRLEPVDVVQGNWKNK